MDIVLAFPVLLLGLGLAAACSGADGCVGGLIQPGLPVVIFVIVLANWPYIARIIRGQVLSLREKEFVEAARSLGASDRRIIFREILPNLVAPIIVYATLLIPANILFEAALSFLGVGVQPPHARWGAMISDATTIFDNAWWFMLFPGLALLLTVLAFNLVGDGLQDALNPQAGREVTPAAVRAPQFTTKKGRINAQVRSLDLADRSACLLARSRFGVAACGGDDDEGGGEPRPRRTDDGSARRGQEGRQAHRPVGRRRRLHRSRPDVLHVRLPGHLRDAAARSTAPKPDDAAVNEPDLAEGDPQISEDGKTVTVKIRRA